MTINDNLHSHTIQAVLLVLVQDVKLDPVTFEGIGYFEEKPLRVTIRVDIVLQ